MLKRVFKPNNKKQGNYTWQSSFTFSPSTDILWNLLPYPSTEFPLYSQQQKRDIKHDKRVFPWTSDAAPVTQRATSRIHIRGPKYRYGQRFRRVRFVSERFNASFLPMRHMADINNHFVSDCTREVRIEGSRGKCTCFPPYAFSIQGQSQYGTCQSVLRAYCLYIFR